MASRRTKPPPPVPSPRGSAPAQKIVKAGWDYTAQEAGELSFKAGELILVTAEHPSGWWTGETANGASGTFPSNFTTEASPTEQQQWKKAPAAAAPTPVATPVVAAAPVVAAPAGGANPLSELRAKLEKRSAAAESGGDSGPSRAAAADTQVTPRATVVAPGQGILKRATQTQEAPAAPAASGPSRTANAGAARSQTMMTKKAAAPPPVASRDARPSLSPARDPEPASTSGGVSAARSAIAGKLAFDAGGAGAAPAPSPRASTQTTTPRSGAIAAAAAAIGKDIPTNAVTRSQGAVKTQETPAPRIAANLTVSAPADMITVPDKAKALYDYDALNEGELTFKAGDEIIILERDESGWWQGDLNGVLGWFPGEFVEDIPKGPTIAERLAEVGSKNARLKAPSKAVRSGRRPPTRGKKAGAAVKSVRTETNDPPVDPSKFSDEPSSVPASSGMMSPGISPLGSGPSRANPAAVRTGLRKTAAPGTSGVSASEPELAEPTTDFRSALRKNTADKPSDKPVEESVSAPVVKDVASSSKSYRAPRKPAVSEPAEKIEPLKPVLRKTPVRAETPEPEEEAPAPAPAAAPAPVASKLKPVSKPSVAAPVAVAEPVTPSSGQSDKPAPALPGVFGAYAEFYSFVAGAFNQLADRAGSGAVSAHPHLKKASANAFSFSLCTVDGVLISFGSRDSFSLQQLAYPFLYSIASSTGNVEQVLKQFPLEKDPSGKGTTPLCPAGIIGLLAQFQPNKDLTERSFGIFQKLSGFASGGVGVDFAGYLTSKKHNSLEKSIAYTLHANGTISGDVDDTLDLLFQIQNAYTSTEQLAIMTATLANGGVSPVSKASVVSVDAATNAGSKMGTKSTGTLQAFGGASGALSVVIPNVGGLAFYSPILNSDGISSKAVELCNSLKQKYQF